MSNFFKELMSLTIRMIYKLTKYWRFYVLLMIASILSFILIFISQNDPKLEFYLPSYFKTGSKYYYYFYKNGAAENIFNLMENVTLDYEYSYTNSRFCFGNGQQNEDVKDNYEYEQFKILFLSISEMQNFKYRQAARQTYGKYLKKFNLKLLFIVGQQNNDIQESTRVKLRDEINEFNDIVQINMPDNSDNYTSIKILISLRWSTTYCPNVDYIYVISDYTVVNHKLLNKYLYTDKLFDNNFINDSVIAGYCNYTDEKLAIALKLFYTNKNLKKPSEFSYKGAYCSNLGWLLSSKAAKKLWFTTLNMPYMMRIAPAYLNGFIAHKANLKHLNIFSYEDNLKHDANRNCLNVFDFNDNKLLCAENFSIASRYNNYIATWNTANDQHHFGMSKL